MKAIIYYRMSSDQQVDSIERQKGEVEPVVEREKYELVAEPYIDKGKSGSKNRSKRMAFLRMMRDIERGLQVDVLVLWDLSRFTRENPFKAAEFYALLMDKGIMIHDCKMGRIDLRTQQGRMIVNLIQEQNHAYSTGLSENSTSGRRQLLKHGWWVAGAIPYGYIRRYVGPAGEEVFRPRIDREYKKPRGWHLALAENEQEAQVVRKIFNMYRMHDTSFRQIARKLNEDGIVPPSSDVAKGWKKDAVRDILANRAYCGYSHIGGANRRYRDKEAFVRVGDNEVKSDKVPAIVSESLWLRVNKKHMELKEASKIVKPTQAGVLSGVLYCGHCRYALAKASRTERNGERYIYYSCQSGPRYPGKCDCAQWRVREDKILAPVVAKIFDAVECHLIEMAKSEEPTAEIEQVNRLRKRIEEIDASVARANRRFLSAANLSSRMEADHRSLIQEYEAEKRELEERIRTLELSAESRAKLVENLRGVRSVVAVRYLDGHRVTEWVKGMKFMQERQAKYGNMTVETTVNVPISVPDGLRGFLKEAGTKVFLFWKKNGSRYWSLDHGNIEVEFDVGAGSQ